MGRHYYVERKQEKRINAYSHIWFATRFARFCNTVHQLAGYTEIAQFDTTFTVNQDIGWFYV